MSATNIENKNVDEGLEQFELPIMACEFCPEPIDLDMGFTSDLIPYPNEDGEWAVDYANKCHRCVKAEQEQAIKEEKFQEYLASDTYILDKELGMLDLDDPVEFQKFLDRL